jgi:hypothetical protein
MLTWPPLAASGGEREVAAMVTEIHVGRGQVDIGSTDGDRWRPARPLLTLREGDTVVTTADAWAVVVLTGGRGTVRIDEATSPFVIPAPTAGQGRIDKSRMILETSLEFLSTTRRELFGNLGSRGGVRPPVILAPRNGRMLPDSLVFEWRGSSSSRYGVRVLGPDGPVLERAEIAATRFEYPKDAPTLTPGVRYRFQLLPAWHPPQEVWFELVDPELARRVRQDLQDLDAVLPEPTTPTAAVLRTGLLAHHALLHDARLGLAAALARHPDEPTLHFLLGELYTRQGLSQEAAEAFAEARFLLGGR